MSTWSYIDFAARVERFGLSVEPLIEKKSLTWRCCRAHWQRFSSDDNNFWIFETVFFLPSRRTFYMLNIHSGLMVQVRINISNFILLRIRRVNEKNVLYSNRNLHFIQSAPTHLLFLYFFFALYGAIIFMNFQYSGFLDLFISNRFRVLSFSMAPYPSLQSLTPLQNRPSCNR